MTIDLKKFGIVKLGPRFAKGERFLKGPIPMKWLNAAACLPGKAAHVAICLWHLSGMTGSKNVHLTRKTLEDAGVQRHAAYRALKAMEEAGLVKVDRCRGRCPIVTIVI